MDANRAWLFNEYLNNAPYYGNSHKRDKDQVKGAGARWDPERFQWYASTQSTLVKLLKLGPRVWQPEGVPSGEELLDFVEEREHIAKAAGMAAEQEKRERANKRLREQEERREREAAEKKKLQAKAQAQQRRRDLEIPDDEPEKVEALLRDYGVRPVWIPYSAGFADLGPCAGLSDAERVERIFKISERVRARGLEPDLGDTTLAARLEKAFLDAGDTYAADAPAEAPEAAPAAPPAASAAAAGSVSSAFVAKPAKRGKMPSASMSKAEKMALKDGAAVAASPFVRPRPRPKILHALAHKNIEDLVEEGGWLRLVYANAEQFKASRAFKPPPTFLDIGSRNPMMRTHVIATREANVGDGAFLPTADRTKMEVVRMTMSSRPSERLFVNYFHPDGRFLMLNAHAVDGQFALDLATKTLAQTASVDVVVSLYPDAGSGVGGGDYVFKNFYVREVKQSALHAGRGDLHVFLLGR